MEVYNMTEKQGGFNYVFEYDLSAGEEIMVIMPPITSNKRGVNDIAWQSDGDITLYGTLSANPTLDEALWQEIGTEYDINKCTRALKIIGGVSSCKVIIRALMN